MDGFIFLADYLGADCVLDDLAKFMGTHASKIDGRNPRGKVHLCVRNADRMANYLHKRQRSTAENCQIGRKSMIPKPPILPVTFQFPCCKTYIHAVCRANWAKGPVCEIAYTTIKCCVCMDPVVQLSPFVGGAVCILRAVQMAVQMGTRDSLLSVHSVGVLKTMTGG